MHAEIAGKLTGPVTKWIVAVVVIFFALAMAPLNAKLVDVQDNEASSWLPGDAESTEVLDALSDTIDPNDIPTLVVYSRDGGLTEDDLAAMDEQAQEIADDVDGVTDAGVLTPNQAKEQRLPQQLLSEDGEAAYLYFVWNFGDEGWNAVPDAADDVRDIAKIDGVTVHLAGFGGQAADAAESFEGIDTNLILATLAVVIIILLFTYRSPVLWLLPVVVCGVRQLHRDRSRLPTGEVRRPHGQRAESGDPQHPGHRRRHRLRAPPGGSLSRRAPQTRGPARGDGVRPAPRRPGDPRQRCHGLHRHAVPGRRRPQLDRRPRPGPRRRHRHRLLRDGHAAARHCW